jgi:hypothetical protein
VNEGGDGEGIWLMDFIYLHEIDNETSCNCFKEERWWGGLTNIQYKPICNCHNESSLYNKCILIKKV